LSDAPEPKANSVQLNIFQLVFVHPEAVAEFVDDSSLDLFANFGFTGQAASMFFC
jgi:hypothetical protein